MKATATSSTRDRGTALWAPAALALLLGIAVPAAAAEKTAIVQTGALYSYVCGAPAVGMTAVLGTTSTCMQSGKMSVTPAPLTRTLATLYGASYAAATRIRGKELLILVETEVAGDIAFELGYAGGTGPTAFTSFSSGLGKVVAHFSPSGGVATHSIDLKRARGEVPAGNRLALRVLAESSTFSGTIAVSAVYPQSLRLGYYENAYFVPDDFDTIGEAVPAVPDNSHVFVGDGTWTGDMSVVFGKPLTLVSENGPDRCILDAQYQPGSFTFNSPAGDSTVVEGLAFVHFSPAVVINAGAYPIIRNCVFRDSLARSGVGGAIQVIGGGDKTAKIENCLFENNACAGGGAIGLSNTGATSRSLSVTDSVFRGNYAGTGGAIALSYTQTTGKVEILRCTFVGNRAGESGGAIATISGGTDVISQSVFEGNHAFDYGGAIYTQQNVGNGVKTISTSIFRGNSTRFFDGGAIYTGAASVNHCNLLENSAGGGGGAMATTGPLYLYNSILRGNTQGDIGAGKEILVDTGGSLSLGYSNIEGRNDSISYKGAASPFSYRGLIDADPQFLTPGILHLLQTSPCIEAGLESPPLPAGSDIVTEDMDGIKLAQGPSCDAGKPDIGAYGYHGECGDAVPVVEPATVFLTAVEDGSPPDVAQLEIRNASETALTWSAAADADWLLLDPSPAAGEVASDKALLEVHAETADLPAGVYQGRIVISSTGERASPTSRSIRVVLHVTRTRRVPAEYSSIQAAIDAAMSGDKILVAANTYTAAADKNLDLRGKALHIVSESGRDATIIDCGGTGRGVNHQFGPPGAILEGFTIKGCNTPSGGNGGGVYVGQLASMEIVDCVFLDNHLTTSGARGGGVYADGPVTISNCWFQSNIAQNQGGGAYLGSRADGSRVLDCAFLSNGANHGGGLYVNCDDVTVLKNTFAQNTVPYDLPLTGNGGGAYVLGAGNLVTGCTFQSNSAVYGGGIYLQGISTTSPSRLVNSVVYDNTAASTAKASYGAGVYLSGSGSEVTNCTLYSNQHTGGYTGGGVGGIYTSSGSPPIRNCILIANTSVNPGGFNPDLNSNNARYIMGTNVTENAATHAYSGDSAASVFVSVSASPPDFRLLPSSRAVDTGTTIDELYSDRRGSVRAVDGREEPVTLGTGSESTSGARFDLGAYEYSEHYGGPFVDSTARAFKNLRINGAIVATGYEYRIQWDPKDPFPEEMDGRVKQAGEYEARLLLVTDAGRRVELGSWKLALGVNYTIPYTFRAAHVGTWRLRLEMASDPNQYALSALFPIQYKPLVPYTLGRKMNPPAGALPGVKPDVNNEQAVYWSTETNELYAIAPYPVQLTWYADKDRTVPILIMGIIQTPADPVFHVAEAPPVQLRPAGTRFGAVNILWSESSATIASDSFTAPQDGWTTLLFKDSVNPKPELRELFTVVRTLTWDHRGKEDAHDPFYPGLPPVDPIYPIEKRAVIGDLINDSEHDQTGACSGGHVLNVVAPYDGAGDDRAYDRPTRSGQIFAVNEDNPDTEGDDLVVIWYRRQGTVENGNPGVCWPFKPVRYDPMWPAPSAPMTCPAQDPRPAGDCDVIQIASAKGSGQLPLDTFGAWDNMRVYNQPDRKLPGFNPNEEHAMLFAAQGTPYPGVFPLRSDLNQFRETEAPNDDWDLGRYTSRRFTLVKYRDPASGQWRFQVYAVEPGDLTYLPFAGNELNPPYPLSQFVFGPCRDRARTGHDGTWTDAVLYAQSEDGASSNSQVAEVLLDKDKKIFFIRGDVQVKTYQFYRLQEGFWYDREDNNGWPDEPAGTCIPFLDGYNPVSQSYVPFDGAPAPMTHNVIWPETPTLYVGETLADAKTQAGEPVGLPNVKNQCIVAVLHDETDDWSLQGNQGVRLFDPLKEHTVAADLTTEIQTLQIKADPPTGTGTNVKFRDLPPQLQGRLTYDDVNKVLKLKGEYITTTGEPVLLLNTLSIRERAGVKAALNLPEGSAFLTAVDALRAKGNDNLKGKPSIARWEADFKAISAGNVDRTGYVTLAFNNHADCPAPTMVNVIEVDCPLYRGDLKVIESSNPFEEKITLRHNGDFGGMPDARWFEWLYLENYPGIPEGPGTPGENWLVFDPDNSAPGPTNPQPPDGVPVQVSVGGHDYYRGLVDITPKGTGQMLLKDRWFATRYRYRDALNYHTDPPPSGSACTMVSPWTPPQLAEGWVKRVLKKVNLFDQRVKDFHKTNADTVASMIAQAGRAYEGDAALSDEPEYLKRVGLIELYQTLLNRALGLSFDVDPPDASLRDAVLLAANRLASLHLLLGNEAYADSADPTIGFGTQDGQYGAMASSIFAFQNQADTLLDEELALLEGRDVLGIRPFYNRLPWNFTIADGEVAYRQVYNITDVADSTGAMEPDGEINEYDAKFLYPQGHGDAWGHYLNAIKKLYYLITHDAVDAVWVPTPEAILVAQAPVEVDYRDERLFATAAAARARAGADIVNLTYRRFYDEDPQRQWLGYRDSNPTRAWGLTEWASRAGQGAYLDWAVGNAILPSVFTETRKSETFLPPGQAQYILGPDYARGNLQVVIDPAQDGSTPPLSSGYTVQLIYDEEEAVYRTQVDFSPVPTVTQQIMFRVSLPAEGIQKVDRTTVVELHEVAAQYDAIQSVLDQADRGLNPLGVAKDTVPFDIDPALVVTGQTHFEQIYGRALQALQNTATVFDYASQSSQMLRRQQDRLDDFKRTIEDREADFTSRLVEVFGYPYPEDCGPGKLYPTVYCETGPDIYHYMYVEPSQLMGAAPNIQGAVAVPRELEYTVKFRELNVNDGGALTSVEVPVTFTVDTDRRFGIIKPYSWTGSRRAPGALQLARSDLLQLQGRFERAIIEYETLLGQVDDQVQLITDQYDLNADEIFFLQEAKDQQITLNTSILNGRKTSEEKRAAAQDAVLVANIAMEIIPKIIGLANDALSSVRGIALGVGQGISQMLMQQATGSTTGELSSQQAKEIAGAEANVKITTARGDFAVKQQVLQLENLVRREAVLRQELDTLVEGLQQSAGRFLTTLASGERILEERLRFRKQTAAQVQDYRYTDMTFRVFRNDALQKYKAQLDLAGRYAYLAAKAYDYETTLLDSSSMAGRAFLTSIVKERSIGTVLGGQPLTGTGLADVLRRLSLNFQVLKPQLGFNNPQVETNRFSLRRELFRVRFDEGSDETWRNALTTHKVDDLWNVPEFRRFCRPFAAEGVAQPGLVIPFRTTVTSGLNFFGWPLGGGDSYYSAANFATKVRSVGVWFSNYNATGLAQTPRVYLVPAGEDVLRSPTGGGGDIRSWHVLDQKLPAPQLVNTTEMAGDRGWIPAVDTILDEYGAPRRHADFKAYHDSGYLEPTELTYDTRLIGRSVWNTKWMLIIPGRNLLYDPDEGLETFISGPEVFGGAGERSGNGISDIKLFFTTYAYSGY